MSSNIKLVATLVVAAGLGASGALAAGDPAKGEKEFNKCKSCHMIADGDNVIVKGGKTGPNLFGVIGRQAGTYPDFKYGDSIIAAGAGGLVWDEAKIVEYLKDPKEFLEKVTNDPGARSKMSFKLAKGGEDVAAYLASLKPATN